MIIKNISTQHPGNEFTRDTEKEFATIKLELAAINIHTQKEYDNFVMSGYLMNKAAKLVDFEVIKY
jgi:hypothetical protein